MANHTITIINQGGGTQSGGSSNSQRTQSRTSSGTHFKSKSSNIGRKIIQGVRVGRTLNIGSAAGMFGGGVGIAIAIGQEVANAAKQGANLYANVMSAKTGEMMRYSNFKNKVNMVTNPFGVAKQAIWDYGVLESMKIARQNETLNYDRQLTGNLILAKNYNNGSF